MPGGNAPTFTRRRVVGLAVAVAVASYFGRFALGGSFEAHVAEVLGLERPLCDELLELLRGQLGADYDARAAAFLTATTAPGRWVMPRGPRRDALEAFVGPLFGIEQGLVTPFVYGGVSRTAAVPGCRLLAPA